MSQISPKELTRLPRLLARTEQPSPHAEASVATSPLRRATDVRNLPAATAKQTLATIHRIDRADSTALTTFIDTPTRTPTAPLPLSPAVRARQAYQLKRRLAPHVAGQLDLTITDNHAVMLSVRREPRRARFAVRLHHLFATAADDILATLGRYVTHNDPDASAALSAFIDQQDHQVRSAPPKPPRQAILRTKGNVYDVTALYARLNRIYFNGALDLRVTWGRHAHAGRDRHSIQLGSYCVEERLIRIHPGLDQHWVPRIYIEWVLYHEMLHAVHPIPRSDGRRHYHSAAFLAAEQTFHDYAAAVAWEKCNVAALLRI